MYATRTTLSTWLSVHQKYDCCRLRTTLLACVVNRSKHVVKGIANVGSVANKVLKMLLEPGVSGSARTQQPSGALTCIDRYSLQLQLNQGLAFAAAMC